MYPNFSIDFYLGLRFWEEVLGSLVEVTATELYRYSVLCGYQPLSVYQFVYHLDLGIGFNSP